MDHFSLIRAIEINPTELCNLQCSFCPRAHGYPNQNLHMSIDTAKEIIKQIENCNFKGKVTFAGRGEPTLTKNFDKIVQLFLECANIKQVNITTNGKRLHLLEKFLEPYGNKFKVKYDVYTTDEKQQRLILEKYKNYENVHVDIKPDVGLNYNEYATPKTSGNNPNVKSKYGTGNIEGMTNRAGFLGESFYDFTDKSCRKLTHIIYINWNGDYNLCCDDWTPLVLGNIYKENISEFLNYNETISYYRKKLVCENSREGLPACQNCNRNAPLNKEVRVDVENLIKMDELTL